MGCFSKKAWLLYNEWFCISAVTDWTEVACDQTVQGENSDCDNKKSIDPFHSVTSCVLLSCGLCGEEGGHYKMF